MRNIILLLVLPINLFAQKEADIIPYIQQYKDIAVREMKQYHIPASITLAQGIHESNAGTSELATQARNHFGIKCKAEWMGDRYFYDDDAKGECFRVYDAVEKSYIDHSLFLSTRDRYKSLFALSPTDYQGWAYGLKTAGYATNPKYAILLIGLIEKYQLYQLDTGVYHFNSVKPPATEQPVQTNYSREPYDFHNIRTITARTDEDPYAVAIEFHIEPELLRSYNDLKPGESFRRGEPIYLQPKWPFGNQDEHIVQREESLWLIAQRHGIRMSSLCAINNCTPTQQPKPGQVVYLKRKKKEQPLNAENKQSAAPSASNESRAGATYAVKPKDTLYSISRITGKSVEDLRRWNGISGNELRVGQVLKVQE